MAKYKFGDRVRANSKNGKVVSALKGISGEYIYRVKFDDGTSSRHSESHVRRSLSVNFNNVKTKMPSVKFSFGEITLDDFQETCPVCRNEYYMMENPILGARGGIWMDCLTCNKTKEQLEVEEKQWKEINNDIKDNSDDFGFYN